MNRYAEIVSRVAGTLEEEDFREDVESLASDLEWMVDLLGEGEDIDFGKIEQRLKRMEFDINDVGDEGIEKKWGVNSRLVERFVKDVEAEVRKRRDEERRGVEVKRGLEQRAKALGMTLRGI
jgi:hypothetical protein